MEISRNIAKKDSDTYLPSLICMYTFMFCTNVLGFVCFDYKNCSVHDNNRALLHNWGNFSEVVILFSSNGPFDPTTDLLIDRIISPKRVQNNQWYFVTKIVLTYCEKKLLGVIEKNFRNSRLKAENLQDFEITRTIDSNSKIFSNRMLF